MADIFDVKKWIDRAQMDFDSAAREASIHRPPIEVVCYLCQQAVEKILKAYIIAKKIPFAKIHDLTILMDMCKSQDHEFNNLGVSCEKLNAYSAAGRYPSSMDIIEYDMRQALKDAEQILVFTRAKLKELGFEYDPDDGIHIITDVDVK